jgi:hypothetical protein
MLDAMRKAAVEHDRSLNAEIVRAVRTWLQHIEADDATDDSSALMPASASG